MNIAKFLACLFAPGLCLQDSHFLTLFLPPPPLPLLSRPGWGLCGLCGVGWDGWSATWIRAPPPLVQSNPTRLTAGKGCSCIAVKPKAGSFFLTPSPPPVVGSQITSSSSSSSKTDLPPSPSIALRLVLPRKEGSHPLSQAALTPHSSSH